MATTEACIGTRGISVGLALTQPWRCMAHNRAGRNPDSSELSRASSAKYRWQMIDEAARPGAFSRAAQVQEKCGNCELDARTDRLVDRRRLTDVPLSI